MQPVMELRSFDDTSDPEAASNMDLGFVPLLTLPNPTDLGGISDAIAYVEEPHL